MLHVLSHQLTARRYAAKSSLAVSNAFLSGNAAVAFLPSGIAPELNRIQPSAVCRFGPSSPFSAPETSLPFYLETNLAHQDRFLPILSKSVAPETQILPKIRSRDPSFKPKSVLETLFLNLGGTYLPQCSRPYIQELGNTLLYSIQYLGLEINYFLSFK